MMMTAIGASEVLFLNVPEVTNQMTGPNTCFTLEGMYSSSKLMGIGFKHDSGRAMMRMPKSEFLLGNKEEMNRMSVLEKVRQKNQDSGIVNVSEHSPLFLILGVIYITLGYR